MHVKLCMTLQGVVCQHKQFISYVNASRAPWSRTNTESTMMISRGVKRTRGRQGKDDQWRQWGMEGFFTYSGGDSPISNFTSVQWYCWWVKDLSLSLSLSLSSSLSHFLLSYPCIHAHINKFRYRSCHVSLLWAVVFHQHTGAQWFCTRMTAGVHPPCTLNLAHADCLAW